MTNGYALRQVRQTKGLSQAQVAEALNTTQQQYSKYENGIQDISARQVVNLATFYNISADTFLGLRTEET